jgi:hypothetical protein
MGGFLVCHGTASAAVAVPLEFRQESIPYNFQSQRGVSISSVINSPPGSGGWNAWIRWRPLGR